MKQDFTLNCGRSITFLSQPNDTSQATFCCDDSQAAFVFVALFSQHNDDLHYLEDSHL